MITWQHHKICHFLIGMVTNVNRLMCDVTASCGSMYQTNPKNLEQSSGSKKLIHGLLQYLWSDPLMQHVLGVVF